MNSKRESKPAAGDTATAVATDVQARPRRYLIAPRAVPGTNFRPMSVDDLHSSLDSMPGINVLRRIKPRTFGMLSTSGNEPGEILVTEMSIERGETLRANAPAGILVEHDDLLKHAASAPDLALLDAHAATSAAARVSVDVTIKVVDGAGKAVPKASVTVYGQAFPAQGTTDASGAVTLSVAGGPVESIRALYVKPDANYWDRFILQPQLVGGEPNAIALKSLSDTFEGFPDKGMTGWGQKLMGLDSPSGIDSAVRGSGVKVGIIDSGCDNSHPQLRHVTRGADLTKDDGGLGWTDDQIAHGTHCAGIIGARSDTQPGITGFAPAAEIHAYKVFPGGRFSDLIEALDMAIADEVDVLNMSLGSDQPSELVAQKLAAASESGIVCVIAAGNSSGPVQFPGTVPTAITIAAIGQTGQFPADSYHALTVGPGGAESNGLFSAKFSCFGPEVKLSAPGVAIVSTVPGGLCGVGRHVHGGAARHRPGGAAARPPSGSPRAAADSARAGAVGCASRLGGSGRRGPAERRRGRAVGGARACRRRRSRPSGRRCGGRHRATAPARAGRRLARLPERDGRRRPVQQGPGAQAPGNGTPFQGAATAPLGLVQQPMQPWPAAAPPSLGQIYADPALFQTYYYYDPSFRALVNQQMAAAPRQW